MKKFMYINDIESGIMLINTDCILYMERETCCIWMTDGTAFELRESEFNDILTELERR